MTFVANLNDASGRAPALRVYLNIDTLGDLPPDSTGPRGDTATQLATVQAAGFEGVQGLAPAACAPLGLGCAAHANFQRPADVAPAVAAWKQAGYACATLHAGTGHESDAEVDALVGEIVAVSCQQRFPLYIETHRATLTQDTWRTVQMVQRHPGVRFNADFSHWYTGLEMPYGDFDAKLRFLQPVLERVRFFHGRMGNSSHIQLPLADPSMAVAVGHFRQLWTQALAGFLDSAAPGDYIVFAPELLSPRYNYARSLPGAGGQRVEESDRWLEALAYLPIIRGCFEEALHTHNAPTPCQP